MSKDGLRIIDVVAPVLNKVDVVGDRPYDFSAFTEDREAEPV
jgi:hypothetical protein